MVSKGSKGPAATQPRKPGPLKRITGGPQRGVPQLKETARCQLPFTTTHDSACITRVPLINIPCSSGEDGTELGPLSDLELGKQLKNHSVHGQSEAIPKWLGICEITESFETAEHTQITLQEKMSEGTANQTSETTGTVASETVVPNNHVAAAGIEVDEGVDAVSERGESTGQWGKEG